MQIPGFGSDLLEHKPDLCTFCFTASLVPGKASCTRIAPNKHLWIE